MLPSSKSGNASRLRSLKTLPTKSTPVYDLQVIETTSISFVCVKIHVKNNCVPHFQFSRRNLLFAAGALSVPK